jgi:type IV pilus assembly protein PilW
MNMNKRHSMPRNVRERGLSMIELLVALAIGSFLIIGAVTVQSQTRKTFDVNESQSRLQENARYVLSILEPDLQLAGLYGYSQDPNAVMWYSGGTLTPPNKLHNPATSVPGLPAGAKTCGNNYVTDVLATVTADNDAWSMTDCPAQGGGQQASTDTLTIRHSGTSKQIASKSKVQIYSNRLSAATDTRIFSSDTAPDVTVDGLREVRDLIVQTYYVAQKADSHDEIPALRMKALTTDGTDPKIIDQELLRGVEDIQVQFGVDPGADADGDGKPDDPGNDGMADFVNGFAARYVNPGDALLSSGQVVAVRVWVRVRADLPEPGFTDDRTYVYGNTNKKYSDGYRRVLMSRTIFLRNSRQQ